MYMYNLTSKLTIEKREYRDGIKRKETRQGWMDGWMLPW